MTAAIKKKLSISNIIKVPYYFKIQNSCMLSHFGHVWLFATLWTAAHQAPLSTEFSKQEYCSVLPCSSQEITGQSSG